MMFGTLRGRGGAFLLAALVLTSCSHAEKRPPVILIGADGVEWSVVEPLLKEGKMPNLQRLLDEGVGGRLATMEPTFSPALWTTIATGREPRAHGIPYFSETDARGTPIPGGLPYTSECRKVPALWNLADAAGLSVTSVAWWVSWPAEQLRHGRVVSSYAAQAQGALMWKAGVWANGLPELSWPEALDERIAPRLKEGGPKGVHVDTHIERFGVFPSATIANQEERARVAIRQRNFLASTVGDRTHLRIFCDLLEEEVSDLNLVYFGSTDVVGHLFWKYHQPQAYSFIIPQDQQDFLGPFVRKSYEELDAWLGEILDRLPEERVVILMSDHGMRAYYTSEPASLQSGNHQEGEPGIFVLSGTGVERQGLLAPEARRLGDIRDVAPFVCDLLGIAGLQEMRPNGLRGLLSETWRTAHPEAARQPTPKFRPAQRPREPMPGVSEEYVKNLAELGYTGIGGGQPPPKPK